MLREISRKITSKEKAKSIIIQFKKTNQKN